MRVPAVRGKILDRNGQPFAENRPTYNVELYLAELGKHFHAEYVRLRPAGARLTRAEREQLEWAARYNVVSNITAQVGDWLQQPQVIDQRKFQRHYNEVRALPISVLQNLNAVQVARGGEADGKQADRNGLLKVHAWMGDESCHGRGRFVPETFHVCPGGI